MKMENKQAKAWVAAQNITMTIDLIEAAKTHLKFLNAVEHRNRFLFEDHALQRAVYRYNAFWLPLLAKHEENPVSDESLVVPLDCELIWHCHRLNPVRYKFDCEKLFGRILTNHKVKSYIQATSKSTSEEIWNKMYPDESYELDLERPFSGDTMQKSSQTQKFTSYDLIAAVKRQTGFTYQACRPHMSDELFLREAEARYKGFLHLIRTNKMMGLQNFCVPTYDVDLMWHTHQLYPDSYCKDMKGLVGGVLPHNDSDPDKSKGSRLDTGFTETTLQWEQTFGFSYWKAGAMSRGDIPTPVTRVPYRLSEESKELNKAENFGGQIHFPTVKAVEVLLECVDIKNLPDERKENLVVAISKKQPDTLFKTKRWLGISSASKDKLIAYFECELAGEFLLELMSYSPSSDELKPKRSLKLLGSCSLSLEDMLDSRSQLWTSKWLSLDLISGVENSEPVLLHVSMSFSPPMRAPQVFHLARCQHGQPDLVETRVTDCSGKKFFSLQKRSIIKDATKGPSDLLTEVYCITNCGEKHTSVECHENYWSVKGTHGSFKLQKSSGNEDSLFEFAGHNKIVKLFPGRRLQTGTQQSENEKSEQDFMTMVEFSTDYPYGRAVGLINSKSQTIKAMDELIVLPTIALAFILSDNLRGDEQGGFNIVGDEKVDEMVNAKGSVCCGECTAGTDNIFKLAHTMQEGNGGNCVGQCSNCAPVMDMLKSKECGGNCVGRCSNCSPVMDMLKSKECMLKSIECGNCVGRCSNCSPIMDMLKSIECGNCVGRCSNCSPVMDMLKSKECGNCVGRCSNCSPVMDMLKSKENGGNCVGECSNCAPVMDMVKAADYGFGSSCNGGSSADCETRMNENDGYGVGCNLGIRDYDCNVVISGYA